MGFEMISAGILTAVAAIILATGIGMGKKIVGDFKQAIILIMSLIALSLLKGYHVILLTILISGILGILLYGDNHFNRDGIKRFFSLIWKNVLQNLKKLSLMVAIFALLYFGFTSFILNDNAHILGQLFMTFSGMSLTLFGGGYVFIPLIQETVVGGFQWLTQKEFADAIAMGQITPGPILISATFIGYKMFGFLGALVATIGIFLPSGLLMVWLSRSFASFKDSEVVKDAFRGIKPAIIGMIFSAAFIIGWQIPLTLMTILIFVGVMLAFLRFKVSVLYLIPISGLLGWLFY
jgi:chromate transporter